MRRHLSYANVAATLALVFTMSGGALAANHYLINSTKQISPKVLKKLKGTTGRTGAGGALGAAGAAGAAGATGKEGAKGSTGPEGAKGFTGPGGEPGTARAYAAVNGDGTINSAHSKNVLSVSTPSEGIYCLKLPSSIPITATTPVATIDITGTGWTSPASASIENNPGSCAGENRIEVVTRQPTGATTDANKAEPFSVVVP
jgi:hypothetical protein